MVLARHGETEPNRVGQLLGRADPPLNERGLQQAAALAAFLTHGPTPTALVTSPLVRARATADAISAATGVSLRVDERPGGLHTGVVGERGLRGSSPRVRGQMPAARTA